MHPTRRPWWLCGLAVLIGVAGLTGAARAEERVLFGPATYTGTSGSPDEFMETIPVPPTLTAPFRLHIQNGNPDGTNRVSSATVWLNGAEVAGPSDFSQQVAAWDRPVTLQANNTLQVRLESSPGSFLVLTLYGTVLPPTLSTLDPPFVSTTPGATVTFTATLSAVQPEPTTIVVQSSNPNVAAVPATVTVPAGQLTAAIPTVTGAAGSAHITVTLNGSSVGGWVTATTAGLSLTGLSPVRLPITPGAAGFLTVTINAAQAVDTYVNLYSDDPSVSAPSSVIVPAGQTSQAFPVVGMWYGGPTFITAYLSGPPAQSLVTISPSPAPGVVSLTPPLLPLTEGSSGTLTVSFDATRGTDTVVLLTTGDPTIAGLPGDRVTVPANTLAVSFPVTGLARGTATVTASLNGSSATAAIRVESAPPTVQGFACPTVTPGATGLCTITLNATQPVDTVVPLSGSDAGLLSVPASVPVPAKALAAQFPVSGLALGTATLTAGPLNGSSQSVSVQVLPSPPTIVSLTPDDAIFIGDAILSLDYWGASTATLTLSLNATQPADTPIGLQCIVGIGDIRVPWVVIVPAGAQSVSVPVAGLYTPGFCYLAASLNGSETSSWIYADWPPPTLWGVAPAGLTLPKGKVGVFTVATQATQTVPTVVPLASSHLSVEVPASVTLPAGARTAAFPVVARAEGSATITVGPLNGSSLSHTVTVTPAELVSLAITPPAPTIAKGETQPFTATGIYTDGTALDLAHSAAWVSSDPAVATITSPGGLATGLAPGQTTLTATVGTLSATARLTVTPPILASLAISPANPTRTVGQTVQFQAIGTLTDGTTQDLTGAVTWGSSNPAVATITSPGGLTTALAGGTTAITATHPQGFTASTTLTVSALPPDPVTVAPPVSPGVATTLGPATEFLYAGPDPIQTGVVPGTIEAKRAAVLRGRVLSREGTPLSGVTISILSHPEYGTTLSRTDGMFDLAVNGGSRLTVQYQAAGFLPAQRPATPSWQEYASLPDVVLIPYDTRVTAIDLSAPTPLQVARGNPVTDSDGTRQATLFFAQGTTATIQLPDGSTQPLTTLSVRATEYTVGANGPKAMPAPLPPTSAYTYAVELSVDQAVTAGAKTVRFSQPVITYVENFLNFPVGGSVPVGYYDRDKAAWLPADNGRVIKLLAITGGLAALDLDGNGTPADASALAALGVTDAERQSLAALYPPGQSLWRVPLDHFSAADFNWPRAYPADATPPSQPPATPQRPVGGGGKADSPTKQCGSVIECQNQILGEAVEIAGTPFRLHYMSNRVPGWRGEGTLRIPLTGPTIPASLARVELEIGVAGRTFTQSFLALPNQAYTFTWDGRDAYGRLLAGSHPALIRILYVYPNYYAEPAPLARSFGAAGTAPFAGRLSRLDAPLEQEQHTTIDAGWDARGQALGGWTLDVQHLYDFGGPVLHRGDGSRQRAEDVRGIITTLAGGGAMYVYPVPDGVPATDTWFDVIRGIAVDGQGNVFISDAWNRLIRKVGPDGIITTVAGDGTPGFKGDGGPATAAWVNSPEGLAVDSQGNLFIADTGNHRIRKIAATGIITTVAGTGVGAYGGDGGPATDASLYSPKKLAVDGQGNLFIADTYNHRIRRVTPDGIISTVAGTGTPGFSGDGGPATAAQLYYPHGIAVDGQGNLFIALTFNAVHSHRIRKVTPEGIITTVAGIGGDANGYGGYGGDGGPATAAQLWSPEDVAVDGEGNLFIADTYNYRIRKVTPEGIITTVAGTGTYGPLGDGGPATAATLASQGIAVDGQGKLFIADTGNKRVRKVAPVYPRFSGVEFMLPSPNGSELYAFSASGRHLRTLQALTGALRYEFGYDPAGRVSTVTDGDGNLTRIERDGAGQPTAMVAPDGQRTTFTLDPNGYLAAITNPAGESRRFTYSPDGLLRTYTTPRNDAYAFDYDALGRLARYADPAAGVKTLDRTEGGNSHTVTLATGLNRVHTYLVESLATGGTRRVDTAPDGAARELRIGTDSVSTTMIADGTVTTLKEGPDPRFGMQAPVPSSLTIRTPSGLTSTLTKSRSLTLSDPNNLLSLTASTDTITLNGRTTTSTYDAATKTFTDRSPAGRQATMTIDAQGRILQEQVTGLERVAFAYDPRGRLSTVTQGTGGSTRTSTFTYNLEGFLETITDPLNRTTRFTYDPAGRVTTQTLPDGRVILTSYDANGNVASITPPSRPAHAFTYTPVDLEDSYTPPDLGIGNVATTYTYNADRQLTQVTRPDGQSITLNYELTGGRLSNLTAPTGQTTFTYHPTTGNLASIASPGGVGLSYTYDGSLLTGTTWTGPVAGSVTRTYDSDFRVASESVNGANPITFQYDPDSLLTQAGDLTLTRHAQHGLLTGTSLGNVTESLTHNTFGELSTYQANYSGSPILGMTYTRDALGWITQKTETLDGVTDTYVYGYDSAGRLTDVTKNGTAVAHYEYDGNGNRLSVTRPGSGTVSGTYDAQDRLVTYGAVSYTYTANGDLQTATSGGETTTYSYDVFGNLAAVSLPNASNIEYLIDGQNRRIGKKVNGAVTQAFMYSGQLRPVAELDGAGAMVSRFVYGTKVNVPEYMIKGGVTYRIITDHLGSPRLVVDTATGSIAQRLDYDEFGQISQDTNPGFQPFGFAGGLYDPDTKLVRFGAREYDAFTGRWTAKDPILFASADPNLYAYLDSVGKPPTVETNLYLYAANNPIGRRDPLGLWYVDLNVSGGFGAGLTGGVLINNSGVYPYLGGGLVTPGVGGSITWSPSDPTTGWNVGLQGQAGIAGQVGYGFGENGGWFWELGVGWPPGASLTGYYVFGPLWGPKAKDPCKR